jgi:hypothetical protein
MRLYHFSEESNIQIFEPRKLEYRAQEPAMVWAIDEFHAPHYFFPRDCPRVCIWPRDDTTDSDLKRFFGHSNTTRIVAIESGWFERAREAALYRYTFESEYFTLYEPNAGYYTTIEKAQPISVERIDDLIGNLISHGIELRITPSLLPLRDAILASTVNFSMIRMRKPIL